jgi:catechol 2,3-dioxygenase-like lactoylglutathione lyase family enzyme
VIKSSIGHLQININLQNLPYYKELFTFLGWSLWVDEPNMLGVGIASGTSLWFLGVSKDACNDHDGNGLNHLAIAVPAQSDVDETVAYMQTHGIAALFETPRHRPEFSSSTDTTYYQVMFETPDGILIEVVYTGPISQA